MKKKVTSMLVIAASILTFGCKTTKTEKTISPEQLAGKWNITLIDGKEAKAEKTPFIDFAAENRIHAQLGCNIYNSSYTYNPSTGELKFSENGQTTMMFCPDMETEKAVLNAINATRKVRSSESGNCIDLLDENSKTLMTICK
ncbi:MAG: META domain-containing protein [Bacteroidales bacterium]